MGAVLSVSVVGDHQGPGDILLVQILNDFVEIFGGKKHKYSMFGALILIKFHCME